MAKPRARDLGNPFEGHPPAPLNAITDVGGRRKSAMTTLIEGEQVLRTGVTRPPRRARRRRIPVFAGGSP
jgi:L-aminopeptidase/D-esterase-like protein